MEQTCPGREGKLEPIPAAVKQPPPTEYAGKM